MSLIRFRIIMLKLRRKPGPRLKTPNWFLLLCIGLVQASAAVHAAEPGTIKAGFAERDITPALGQERPGGYGKAFHKKFHDPCKVRVAVFADDRMAVAIVGVDALMLSRAVVQEARAGIARATPIAADAVLISASHSHSSGPVGMVQPGEYDAAPPELRRLAYEESSLADAAYLARVREAIVEGVKAAHTALVPARLGFGIGREERVGFNRRLRMKNGQTWTNPGAGNPDALGYDGPIDPDVGVIGAWTPEGGLLGVIVNHALHANVMPDGISANWIYHLEQTIQGALQTKAPVVFLPGACGDISKLDALSRFERPSEADWMRMVGGRVGAEAVKVLLSAHRGADVPLAARSKVWRIARRVPSAQHVESARRLIAAGKPTANPMLATDWMFAKETLMAEFLARTSPEVEVEAQAVQVGPVVCLTNPAEYFVANGLAVKMGSPFPITFCVELANGCVGYVPTEAAFGPGGGGYETRLTSYSNLAIDAGRQFAEAGIELAKALQPGRLPEPRRIPRPGAPWRYGNVPPQPD